MRIELADGDFYDIEMVTGAEADERASLGAAVIFDSAHGWHTRTASSTWPPATA
jgi:hypothetical protein